MDYENVIWGELLERKGINESESNVSNYVKINPTDEKYASYLHCSHCLIYARTKSISLRKYERKAIVLMQIRFDGRLGFPGGGVDHGETPVQGLNRELREESGWFEKEGPITQEHHLFTHLNKKKEMVLHFYAIEVPEEKIKQIERSTLEARDYGGEVLGTCRVPLYTMQDAERGFPSFLCNNFAGNAKIQLIEALVNLKILSAENVIQALNSRPTMEKKVKN